MFSHYRKEAGRKQGLDINNFKDIDFNSVFQTQNPTIKPLNFKHILTASQELTLKKVHHLILNK
jgi:hypothetical protein